MGRPPKNQSNSYLKTRSIGSYFQSDTIATSSAHVISSAKTRLISSYFKSDPSPTIEMPISNSHSKEPSPPIEQEVSLEPDSPLEQDLSMISVNSAFLENLDSSDTVESDTEKEESAISIDPLYNPFTSQEYELGTDETYNAHVDDSKHLSPSNPSSPLNILSNSDPSSPSDPFSPSKTSILSKPILPKQESPWRDLAADLGTFDSLELMTYSSQPSGESLRRLALSPRKQMKKKDLTSGSGVSKPMLTFSEKLAAEMGESDNKDISSIKISKTTILEFDVKEEKDDAEPAEVEGSDSGSEADWNDEVIHKKSPVVTTSPKRAKEAVDALLGSDDDIPTLGRFATKKAKLVLEESDSDLDDNPFGSDSTGLSSPSPISSPSEDTLQELDEDPLDNERGSMEKSKKQGTRNKRAITPPRSGRNLRSSVIKPVLSPISPVKPPPKPKTSKKPVLFSLDSLLNEKKRKVEIGYDLESAKNQMMLDDRLIEEYDEDEDEDSFYGTEVIPKGILTEEQEGVLSEIMQDEQIELIEDVAEYFVRWPQDLSVQPLEPGFIEADPNDPVVQKVIKYTRTEAQRIQFLTSPFLMIMSSSPWEVPRSLFRWLVHIVTVEQNQLVILSVFALLQRVLSQRTSVLGVDHQDLVRAFKAYGAKDEYLDQDWKVAPVTRETRSERLIQIRKIVNLLLRMTTDPIIGDIKSLLGTTLVALLDAIPANSWETELHILCSEIIQTLGTSSPFILLVLRQLPSLSLRITLLRRSIALEYLGQPKISTVNMSPDLNELHRALFVDKGFAVNSETVYKELGRRIQIFGFCLDDEQMVAAYGRKELEPLLKKLRFMHGKIIDVRAAFMERTWAKDMIQRLYMRLYYAGIHRQMAKQTTLNFGDSTRTQTSNSTDQPQSTGLDLSNAN
ncbi:hypothetical protein BGZ49_001092, partial [Haplosporangium sp. Z 27]